MPTLASQLVQFLMGLFNNPHAAQAFLADPERALMDAGLGNVGAADVHAAMPVVLDYAPIVVDAFSPDREYHPAGYDAWTEQRGMGGTVGAGPSRPPAIGGSHLDDHGYAVQQLQHVVNNYSYTSTVDDRDVTTDQTVHENIWATGDVRQFFDSHTLIAPGEHAFAAGDDIDLEDSFTVTDSATDHSAGSSAAVTADSSVAAGPEATFGTEPSFGTEATFGTEPTLGSAAAIATADLTSDGDSSFSTDDAVDDSSNVGDSFTGNSVDSVEADAHVQDGGASDGPAQADTSGYPGNSDVDLAVDGSFHDNADFWAADTADAGAPIDDIDDARFTGVEDSGPLPDDDVPDHDADVQTHVTEAADGA